MALQQRFRPYDGQKGLARKLSSTHEYLVLTSGRHLYCLGKVTLGVAEADFAATAATAVLLLLLDPGARMISFSPAGLGFSSFLL